jgi:hypothetical protein
VNAVCRDRIGLDLTNAFMFLLCSFGLTPMRLTGEKIKKMKNPEFGANK